MSNQELTLYGSGTSRTLRTLWQANELQLEFTHVPARARNGDTKTPAFLALSSRHKVPIIRHGDLILTESAAIMTYLADHFPVPEHCYVAKDAVGRAEHLEWCFFIMTELDANGLYTMRRHGDLRSIYGESPTAVQGGADYFLYQIERMEKALRASSPFLMGDKISPADILLTSCLDWAIRYGLSLPQYLLEYRETLISRPAYVKSTAQNSR